MLNGARRGMDLGGLAGVVGIAVPSVGLLALPIWRFPDTAASGADVVGFVRAHRAALQVTMVCNTIGVTLWLVLGAAVWARMRATERESALTTGFGVGIVAMGTLLLAGFTAFDVLVHRPPGAAGASLLYDLTFGMLAMSGMPTAVALGAYAAFEQRTGLLGAFVGRLALAAAIAHVVLLASFVVPSGFFALEGQVITVVPALLWAWVLAAGIALLRRPYGAAMQCSTLDTMPSA